MVHEPASPSREERLAAKLRENLHRRKAQARALAQAPLTASRGVSENDSPALPNPPPES